MKKQNFKAVGKYVLDLYDRQIYFHKDELTEDSYVDGFEDGCLYVADNVYEVLKAIVDKKSYKEIKKMIIEKLGC